MGKKKGYRVRSTKKLNCKYKYFSSYPMSAEKSRKQLGVLKNYEKVYKSKKKSKGRRKSVK